MFYQDTEKENPAGGNLGGNFIWLVAQKCATN